MNKKLFWVGIGMGLIGSLVVNSTSFFNKINSEEVRLQPTALQPVLSAEQPEVDSRIPKPVYPCLQLEEVKRIVLLGSAREQKQSYYLVEIQTEQDSDEFPGSKINEAWELLIKVNPQDKCTSLHPGDEVGPLTLYVSAPTANQLALQRLQHEITEAGGKDKYQQDLIDDGKYAEAEFYFTPEQIWAFKRLGIRLPAKYQVLRKKFNVHDDPPREEN